MIVKPVHFRRHNRHNFITVTEGSQSLGVCDNIVVQIRISNVSKNNQRGCIWKLLK